MFKILMFLCVICLLTYKGEGLCGDDHNAETGGCGTYCHERCVSLEVCTLPCIEGGCKCKKDYLYDEELERCVPPGDCNHYHLKDDDNEQEPAEKSNFSGSRVHATKTRPYIENNKPNFVSNRKKAVNVATNVDNAFKFEEIKKKRKTDTVLLLKSSNLCPFRWHRNKYKCFCCAETFTEFKDVKAHMATHCFKEIAEKITGNFVYHKVEVSALKCDLCGKEIKQYTELKTHLNSEHKIVFDSKDDLLIPFKLDDGIFCGLCNKTFLVFHTLNVHMNQHFRNHICETCGQGFTNEISMREHTQRHVKRNFICKKCNLTFSSVHKKETHNVAMHKNVEKRVCPFCPERFSGHYNKLLHMIEKHGYKKPEYKCTSCTKVFLRQFLLNSHVRKSHMKERNFECNVCGLKFFGKSDISQHMTSHTGEKKHTCAHCGKSYARKWTLTDHMKIHNS